MALGGLRRKDKKTRFWKRDLYQPLSRLQYMGDFLQTSQNNVSIVSSLSLLCF